MHFDGELAVAVEGYSNLCQEGEWNETKMTFTENNDFEDLSESPTVRYSFHLPDSRIGTHLI